MAPFSIPAPCIIPLKIPVFGGPKTIDTNTEIQLTCDTYLDNEIFYTLDGTKPQPYAGIVQGNKTIKYTAPFCLPAGKITIKAVAINAVVHTMCSSVITKNFEVLKVDSEGDDPISPKSKQRNKVKMKAKSKALVNKKNEMNCATEEKIPDTAIERSDSKSLNDNEPQSNCFEKAFIGNSDFDIENSDVEGSIDDETTLPIDAENAVEADDDLELSNDFLTENIQKLEIGTEKSTDVGNATLTDSGTSIDTRFCCLKCDLTLQQCITCNKMNAVSSKFCIECGKQLLQICYFCKEWNPSSASFCQFCGRKLGSRLDPYTKTNEVDQSILVKPYVKNAGVQSLASMVDKCTQTVVDRSPVKKKFDMKCLSHHSPGRGYWHQQLDYICNHLKSHAYNNIDFRKEISKPTLCDFKSAHIVKEENNIIVTIAFSPLADDKTSLRSSGETNPKKEQDNT